MDWFHIAKMVVAVAGLANAAALPLILGISAFAGNSDLAPGAYAGLTALIWSFALPLAVGCVAMGLPY